MLMRFVFEVLLVFEINFDDILSLKLFIRTVLIFFCKHYGLELLLIFHKIADLLIFSK